MIKRAEAATANPSAGVRRRGRANSGGRKARTEVSDTSISISVSGVYGGTPQHAASSSSRINSSFVHGEAAGHVCDGRLPDPGQPSDDGEQAPEPLAGLPARHGASIRSSPDSGNGDGKGASGRVDPSGLAAALRQADQPRPELGPEFGWLEDLGVVEQTEDPRNESRETRPPRRRTMTEPSSPRLSTLSLPTSSATLGPSMCVDADARDDVVARPRPARVHRAGMPGCRCPRGGRPRRVRQGARRPRSGRHETCAPLRGRGPMPPGTNARSGTTAPPEPPGASSGGRRTTPRPGCARPRRDRSGAWRHQRGDGADLAQTGGAQLQKSIPPARIVEVHAGNGQVESNLLVGLERQVRQVERVAVDQVPVLLLAGQAAAFAPGCPRRAGVACPVRRLGGAPHVRPDSRAPAGRWRPT